MSRHELPLPKSLEIRKSWFKQAAISTMTNHRIKFRQKIGSFAVIQGTVQRVGDLLEFELAMTETIAKPVNGIVIPHSDRTLYFEADENGTISGFTLGAERAWGFWFARQTVATA